MMQYLTTPAIVAVTLSLTMSSGGTARADTYGVLSPLEIEAARDDADSVVIRAESTVVAGRNANDDQGALDSSAMAVDSYRGGLVSLNAQMRVGTSYATLLRGSTSAQSNFVGSQFIDQARAEGIWTDEIIWTSVDSAPEEILLRLQFDGTFEGRTTEAQGVASGQASLEVRDLTGTGTNPVALRTETFSASASPILQAFDETVLASLTRSGAESWVFSVSLTVISSSNGGMVESDVSNTIKLLAVESSDGTDLTSQIGFVSALPISVVPEPASATALTLLCEIAVLRRNRRRPYSR